MQNPTGNALSANWIEHQPGKGRAEAEAIADHLEGTAQSRAVSWHRLPDQLP
jgi:hypothetical protein